MKDPQDRPARKPQPWHAADEKPAVVRKGEPIGTHSLTGGGAAVGQPTTAEAEGKAERSSPRDEPPGAAEPDPLLEPRASGATRLGPKP